MMVVPIVAMLAVTMVVAGWQYEEQVEIDVDDQEAFDEVTIENNKLPDKEEPVTNLQNESVATVVYINEKSYLEFEVEPRSITLDSEGYRVTMRIQTESVLTEELNPERFIIEAEGIGKNLSAGENTVAFQYSVLEEDGLS